MLQLSSQDIASVQTVITTADEQAKQDDLSGPVSFLLTGMAVSLRDFLARCEDA